MTHIAIVGIAGRMGGELLETAGDVDGVTIVAGVESSDSPELDTEMHPGDVPVTDDPAEAFASADIAIDFSSPAGCVEAAEAAAEADVGFVSGTTGLDEAQTDRIDSLAARTPVLRASNFSVGINLLLKLVADASEATDGDFDVEIFEAHHRNKVDAPSGTALSLGESAADARDWELEEVAQWGRHGEVGERDDDEIGFQVMRGGGVVGDHTVSFCGPGERIELTHRAGDRGIFARGALTAAKWLEGREAGMFTMKDVLFG
ncbi:MAG: 4-hydroxy-tetrahydrodipicolinate reductase [Bradymonadaceae bacterium]